MPNILKELRRRNVFRVAAGYVVVGWLIVQVVSDVAPMLELPVWFGKGVLVLLLAGLPIALIVAWIFEMSPEGLKRTAPAPESGTVKPFAGADYALIGLLVLVLAVSGYQLATRRAAPAPVPDRQANASEGASIAVLPFADMSAGGDQEYFADGMAEEILHALVKIEGLHVAGRSSSFSFKGRSDDLRAIGEILGVAHVLEGSVRKQDNRLRITAQLVRTDSGFHLWSEVYDASLDDVFRVQEDISRAIVRQLKIVLTPENEARLVPKATDDNQAYMLFLQGRSLLARRVGDSLPRAVTLFEEAVARDPRFARAWAGLAAAEAVTSAYVETDLDKRYEATQRAAIEATALDPTLGEPFAAIGLINASRRDYHAMHVAFQRALERDPDDVTTSLWSGIGFLSVGHLREAEERFRHVTEIDPGYALGHVWLGFSKWIAGDLDGASILATRGIDLGHPVGKWLLAEIADSRGDPETALRLMTEAISEGGIETDLSGEEHNVRILLSGAFGVGGGEERARTVVDAYLSEPRALVDRLIPFALLHMGDTEQALSVFASRITNVENLFFVALWGPAGQSARQHPEFPAFAERIGLVEYWTRYGWPDLCHPVDGGEFFTCD